jgi:uncharacterized protein YgiM (DUF1202 family)
MKTTNLILIAGLWLAGLTAAQAAPTQMSIQIQTGQLRATPTFLGKIVTSVKYADRVEVITKQAGWSQVRTTSGQSGWIHDSALTRDKLVLKAGAADVSRTASGEELALAGKGFNSDVEADFKSKNQNIDFTWIDKMEKIVVNENEIVSFFREGGLQ